MKNDVRYVASNDKLNWFKNHSLSEEARKKLIDGKVKRILNQIEFNKRFKSSFIDH